jgi:hypothetical protein
MLRDLKEPQMPVRPGVVPGGTSGCQAAGVNAGAGHPPMMHLAMQEGSTGERQFPEGRCLIGERHGAAPHETDRTRGRLDERKGNGNDR